MIIDNLDSLDTFYNRKKYNSGSAKDAYLYNKTIVKIPRNSERFNMEHYLDFFIKSRDYREYNTFLAGTNQILNEILIYSDKDNNNKNILCPIVDFAKINNNIITQNYKLIPANRCLNQSNFDLSYFCNKMNYDKTLLLNSINILCEQFSLDAQDITDNDDNFGYDVKNNKILILDYGYKNTVDYCDNYNLYKKNMELIEYLFDKI